MKHEEISEKYRKWVIKYYSERFSKPVFFIWFTDISDKEEKDQILTTETNRIIVAKSDKKIIERILENEVNFPDSKRMKKWLKKSSSCKKISSTKYDLRKIEKKILSNRLETKDIEGVVNFINLYEDYKSQIGKRKSRTKRLNKIWDYYYEQVFHPNFNRKNQNKYIPNKLKINHKKLFKEFSVILEDFENKFEFIEKGKSQ